MKKAIFQKEIDALSIVPIKDFDSVKEEYHEQDLFVDGHRNNKRFFRVDREVFSKLLLELQNNENCDYITYANEVIKEGFVPKKLSCLLKPLRFDRYKSPETNPEELIVNEVLTSQLLNYFGCSTVYNVPIKVVNRDGKNEYALLSVDFLNADNEFKTFNESELWIGRSYLSSNEIFKNFPKCIYEEYAYAYLIRFCLLHDGDLKDENFGILKNKVNGNLKVINFDYEFSFDDVMPAGKVQFLKDTRFDLETIKKYCPKVYNKFMSHCTKLSIAINKISKWNVKILNKYHKNIVFNRLKRNLKYIEQLNVIVNQNTM